MPNPPTPAARLAAVKDCFSAVGHYDGHADVCDVVCDEPRLTALLAADPPGATVTVLCDCGHDSLDHDGLNGRCYCMCPTFTPTTARVTSERALTEEERNG